MPSDFGILLVTKNTYSMVDEWFSLSDYSNIPILNIDLNSDYKNKSYGKNLCKEKGINFLDCDGTEMQKNINQAVDFFKEKYENYDNQRDSESRKNSFRLQHECF